MTMDGNMVEDADGPGAQARAWIVHLKSGSATRADLDAFGAWRVAAAENNAAYRDTLATWQLIGAAFAPDRADGRPSDGAPRRASAPMRAPINRRQMLVGAGAAAAAVIALPLVTGIATTPAGATVLVTRKGERRTARLGAGVVVELNTDTKLISWQADGLRQVRLDRGEALFAVDVSAAERLQASAGDTQVSAGQARFLLRWTDGKPYVWCVAGAVDVRDAGRSYTLAAGQAFDPAAGVAAAPDEAVDTALHWRSGYLVFKDRPAGEVIAELNRYRGGRVFLPGSHAGVPISGVIRLDRADLAVDHIATSLGMKATRLPAGIVVIRE